MNGGGYHAAAMPLLGVTLTATGVQRLEARPPQLAVVTALSRGLLGHARLLAQSALDLLPAAGLPLAGAVLKTRLKGSGNTPERAKDDVVGETPPDKLIVRESGVPYEVHLRGGIN